MKYRLTHSPGVPLRDQIATQIFLGMGSGELPPGTRLPSTREMARRFEVHANTVSAAYRRLAREGLVILRKGSGVYVAGAEPPCVDKAGALEDRIAAFFAQAGRDGIAPEELQNALQRFVPCRPTHFLLVEPDADLRAIVVTELEAALSGPVDHCGYPEADAQRAFELRSEAAILLSLPSKAARVRALLAAGAADPVVLQITSVPASLSAYLPAPADALVAIASRWPPFLDIARTMLVGAGLGQERLLLADARIPGWQGALKPCDAVVCDAHTALTARHARLIRFAIVSEASLAALKLLERGFTARGIRGASDNAEARDKALARPRTRRR